MTIETPSGTVFRDNVVVITDVSQIPRVGAGIIGNQHFMAWAADTSQPDRSAIFSPQVLNLAVYKSSDILIITIADLKIFCVIHGILPGARDGTAVFEKFSVFQITRLLENVSGTSFFISDPVVVAQRQESEVICILIA